MNKKYHGSRMKWNKRFVGLLALALIIVCAVGGTVAFLTTHTGAVKNTFTAGDVTTEIVEEVEGGTKKSVQVENTGNVPAYIRVAVVANNVGRDADNNVVILPGTPDLGDVFDTTKWTHGDDGYYYYNGVVQPGNLTAEMLKEGIELKNIQVTILASAIQADPDKAVQDAWNMSFSDGGWVSVPSGN